ncbi:hypothetical protein JMN32_22060 [Fulvivirga sp. 29W222]|uniref:Uncharacterized protein n=1 Tax=Fulvivirga marina TaxID=2494733 RepID=A0A937KDU5_9BACT|nr:hypothetical protein [Fulvivirga marina]MBL6449012.1 hypothetical protein [Fulvivirga marina]
MIQRDFILKEIEKLNLLIAKITGLKNDGKTDEANTLINNHVLHTSGFTIHELEPLDTSETIEFLKKEKKLSVMEFKVLAELCFQAAELASPLCSTKSINLYKKSLVILEHITATEKTYDFEREDRTNVIRSKINDCN